MFDPYGKKREDYLESGQSGKKEKKIDKKTVSTYGSQSGGRGLEYGGKGDGENS